MTPERMAVVVAWWVRRYTRHLPPPVSERRIDEIDGAAIGPPRRARDGVGAAGAPGGHAVQRGRLECGRLHLRRVALTVRTAQRRG